MNRIHLLKNNRGFAWASEKNIFAKGYVVTPEDKFVKGEALVQLLLPLVQKKETMIPSLRELNGVFSFIYLAGADTYLYCDKTRFFPLYFRSDPKLLISDDPYTLVREGDSIDTISTEEFRCTGFTTGNTTLINEIKQVPAGELLHFSAGNTFEYHRIFSYKVRPDEIMQQEDPMAGMYAAIEKAAIRFVQSIGDGTPVLPLSGGYDSRLIACILKSKGYSNTICFTYGRRTREVDISRDVAALLGFKWYFVDYESFEDESLSAESTLFQSYFRQASGLTSMFYLQEYPAVLYLMKHNLIPTNSVFLPGHSGDLLGGSQFVKVFSASLGANQIVNKILRTKFIWFPVNGHWRRKFRPRIEGEIDKDKTFLTYSLFEDWDIREKIAKFLFNSSRVFTFFDFQVRFFFWDNELMDYFRRLPAQYKNHKQLYDRCLREKYFDPLGLNFKKEISAKPFMIYLQKLKNWLKPLLPYPVRYRYILKNDWACYEKFTMSMYAEIDPNIRKKLPFNGFNSLLINWYLTQVKRDLSRAGAKGIDY